MRLTIFVIGKLDDGLATVAWLKKQPWFPGSFATTGKIPLARFLLCCP